MAHLALLPFPFITWIRQNITFSRDPDLQLSLSAVAVLDLVHSSFFSKTGLQGSVLSWQLALQLSGSALLSFIKDVRLRCFVLL